MWRPDDEINHDLRSSDPARIVEGLRDLEFRMDVMDEFEIAPLESAILAPFTENIPQDTQLSLLRIITYYQSFMPSIDDDARRNLIAEIILRYGSSYIALEASLLVKNAEQPGQETAAMLRHIAEHGLTSPQEIQGASYFVSYLLAGEPEVRSATVQALKAWPTQPEYREVIDFIIPELTDEEQQILG